MTTTPIPQRTVCLIGGGGHALVVAHVAALSGLGVAGFFDDQAGAPCASLARLAWLGPLADSARCSRPVILAMGDLSLRRRLLASLRGAVFADAWWCDRAVVEQARATVGPGALLAVQSVVQPFSKVGAHAIINTGAIVEHECEVGENSHIAPGAVLGGNVRVGRDTLVGLGSRVLPGVTIGSRCVVGAGAVVTKDVPDDATVVGVPGRVVEASRR